MLEEALSSDTFPPAEAALALLSYVRYELPAGGANAEARFFRLFSLLCDRLFGRVAGPKEHFRYEVGGWLSRSNKWSRPVSSTSTSGSGSAVVPSKSQSIESDPVVQLLAGIAATVPQKENMLPTLIEAISAEVEHRPGIRFPFPLGALPIPTQDVMMALFRAVMVGKPVDGQLRENAARLCGSLLLVSPKDQGGLKAYHQSHSLTDEQKRPLALSPGLMLSPRAPSSTSPSSKEQSEVTANIMLSMLEFYLFSFIRFPLATPVPSASQSQPPGSSSSTAVPSPGIHPLDRYRKPATPYGEQVYVHLFRGYLKVFLPHDIGIGPFIRFATLSRESELFLRIAIEFWFDGNSVIPTTAEAVEAIQKRRSRAGGACSPADVAMAMSYDLIGVKVVYEPPPVQVRICLRSLVNHVVKHPDIPRASLEISEISRLRAAGRSTASAQSDCWCLSPSMTILQLSFYNFVRTTFHHAPIYAGSSGSFQAAFDSWLIWLEPWNIEMRKKSATLANAKTILTHTVSTSPRNSQKQPEVTPVIVVPKPTSKSKYSKKWEPYIAANLHLYTVPLAIFLHRARELDFSSKEFRRSLTLVQRVFRVFSPDVVNAINALLTDTSHPLSSAVAKHDRNLGAYSPTGFGQLSLSLFRSDMHNLLEEVFSTHMKTMRELDFLDRIAAYLGVGDVTASEEKELKALVTKAKVIVDLPVDYEVIPAERKQAASKTQVEKDDRRPERQSHGFLTEHGKEQLLNGSARCTPLDVVSVGDQLHSRAKSYEIPQLVPLTIKASDWMNLKLGLVSEHSKDANETDGEGSLLRKLEKQTEESKKYWFIVNFRFLADYRTMLWICFLSWLWWTLR